MNVVQARKFRDVLTGNLSGFHVSDGEVLGGRPAIIVDDICDGGGTFVGLARELRKHGVTDLTLAVTHGLFTQGRARLTEDFSSVRTFAYAGMPRQSGDIHFQHLFDRGVKV